MNIIRKTIITEEEKERKNKMKILRLTGCIDLLIFFKVTCISKRIILIFSDSGSSSLKSLHSNSQSDVPTNQIDALLSVRYLFMFFFYINMAIAIFVKFK